jgi:hypothetical protein
MKHVHFLIYRLRSGESIRWNKPVGGLVMRPKRVCAGIEVADFGLAEEIAQHRYHCGPGEELILAEVLEEKDQVKSHRLHHRYERDFEDFLELMTGERL